MNGTYLTVTLLAAALLSGCLEPGPGQKLWVAGQGREGRISRAMDEEAWLGMTKGQLERALRTDVFPDHIVDFSYGRPDEALFGAQFDEALVIHRPLKFDDVWILFRDDKVAAVKAVFIE